MQKKTTLTPALKQYLKIKSEYPDTLLFFQMGDFYELFFDDAKNIARLLDLTLTQRGTMNGAAVPLAGVPIHAADNYIARLVRLGKSIVVCNQISDPQANKGIIERKIVRVITPGTLTEDNLLQQQSDNLIVAIHPKLNHASLEQEPQYGLAVLDLTSGHFVVKELVGNASLGSELTRLNPAECIVSEDSKLPVTPNNLQKRVPWSFDYDTCQKILCEQLKVMSLDGFGCTQMTTAICAAGALLQYVQEMQKSELPHIQAIHTEHDSDYLLMDANSRACLEIDSHVSGKTDHTLVGIHKHTQTNMGARCLARWFNQPLRQGATLDKRQEMVTALVQYSNMESLRDTLKQSSDLERIIARIALGNARPRDLLGVRDTLILLPEIKTQLAQIDCTTAQNFNQNLQTEAETVTLLTRAIVEQPPATIRDGGVIKRGYDAELDDLRNHGAGADQFLMQMESKERRNTRASGLKISYNRIHYYYIEIPKSQTTHIPEYYRRIQTLKNAERYTTPELSELGEKISSAHERSLAKEKQLYQELQNRLHPKLRAFQYIARTLAEIDVFATLAWCAMRYRYTCPQFTPETKITITAGRHPVVEQSLEQAFVANDTELNAQRQMLIITGPNMGGKSTYMRQIAHIVLLAHIGAYVPADSACIGPIHRIFTRIGAADDIASGRSTFMVEMTEAANILNNADKHSLVIMDEIGRGTSTFDGLSLAWACAQHLATKNHALTLFATHYFELTRMANELKNIYNVHTSAIEHQQQIVLLHRIREGAANQSYGIHVANLAGIPAAVVTIAQKKLAELESQQLLAAQKSDKQQIALPLDEATQPGAQEQSAETQLDIPGLQSMARTIAELNLDELNAKKALDILYQLQSRLQGTSTKKPSR